VRSTCTHTHTHTQTLTSNTHTHKHINANGQTRTTWTQPEAYPSLPLSHHRAVAFEMNKTFAKAMSDKVDHYNKQGSNLEAGVAASAEGRGAEKIQKVRGEIEEVKQVMTENIDRILERGDKIELLVDKSSHLQEQVSPLEVRVCSRACDVSGFFSGVGVYSAFSLSLSLLCLCLCLCRVESRM
jgi:hypothetical protein